MYTDNLLLNSKLNILRSKPYGGRRLPAALFSQLGMVLADNCRTVAFELNHFGPELGDGN
jgi:hypothetical protein